MPWAQEGRSLSTFVMSIHHLDTFRYWLGDPVRVLASTRPRPANRVPACRWHQPLRARIRGRRRAAGWDDVWAGPAREGAASEIAVRWRFEGTEGLALGAIGWPGWPDRVPSTIDYSTIRDAGAWHRPRWEEAWFPDAFAGTMGGLLHAVETGSEPDIPGRDNLKTIALCEAVLGTAAAASTGSIARSASAFTSRSRRRERRGSLKADFDQTEVFYHSLVETIPQMILCKDLEGRFTFANQKFCAELGRTLEEIKGKTDLDFFPKELAEKYRQDDKDVLESGQLIDIVEEHVTPKGEKLYVQVMKTPLFGPDGRPIGIQGIFWNVTERMRAEEMLKQQNVTLQELAESERQAHEALKAAQSRMVETEKLASLGQLVAGVAHEINNPLAFVSNNVAVLERDLRDLIALIGLYRQLEAPERCPSTADLCGQIDEVSEQLDLDYTLDNLPQLIERTREGLRRIERIVKDLRLFARVDEGEWNEVDLNPGIESSVNMVQGYARKTRRSPRHRARAAAAASAAAGRRIHQVVVNLLMNAIDACPPEDTVTIRTASRARGRGRADRGRRHRLRHRAGDPRADLRPVLHHQADRRGDRPGAFDQLRNRPGAPRNDRRPIHPGAGELLHRPAAPGTRARASPPAAGRRIRATRPSRRMHHEARIDQLRLGASRPRNGVRHPEDQGDRLRLDRHLRRPARYRRRGKATDHVRVRQGRLPIVSVACVAVGLDRLQSERSAVSCRAGAGLSRHGVSVRGEKRPAGPG